MTATVLYSLSSTWTPVSAGSAAVTLYLQGANGAIIYVGASTPAVDTTVGIQLSPSDRSTGFTGLSGTDNVYVRSVGRSGDGPSTGTIVVIRSGS